MAEKLFLGVSNFIGTIFEAFYETPNSMECKFADLQSDPARVFHGSNLCASGGILRCPNRLELFYDAQPFDD